MGFKRRFSLTGPPGRYKVTHWRLGKPGLSCTAYADKTAGTVWIAGFLIFGNLQFF
jgi:hypothetical protein